MKKNDAHAHIGYFGGWVDVGISPDEMTLAMKNHSIERSIVCHTDNELSLQAARAFPNQLIPIAWLNPFDGEKAVEALERLVRQEGFQGLKLHPLFSAFTANDPIVYPLMEKARELSIPVFIHSGHAPFSLPWSIAQLADVYKDIPIVMVHMGHGHGIYIQAAIDMAMKYDNLWLETSGMPMHTKIKEAYERVGADRLFWGSDAPFHDYGVEILRTTVSGLTDQQLEQVFYSNIQKFMRW